MHPGVVSTNLANKANWFVRCIFSLIGKSPKKGAETLIYLTENPKLAQTGGYYVNKRLAQTTTKQSKDKNAAAQLLHILNKQVFYDGSDV
jgi:hypothetical protein